MTFETETARDCTRALRLLALVFILVVAVWASSGGLDQMLTGDPAGSPPAAQSE